MVELDIQELHFLLEYRHVRQYINKKIHLTRATVTI